MGDTSQNGNSNLASIVIDRSEENHYNRINEEFLERAYILSGDLERDAILGTVYNPSIDAEEINNISHELTLKTKYSNALDLEILRMNEERPANLPSLSAEEERQKAALLNELKNKKERTDIEINTELAKLSQWLAPEEIAEYAKDLKNTARYKTGPDGDGLDDDKIVAPAPHLFSVGNSFAPISVGVGIPQSVQAEYLDLVISVAEQYAPDTRADILQSKSAMMGLSNTIDQLNHSNNITEYSSQITRAFNSVARSLSPEEFANYKAGFLNHHDLTQGQDGNFTINQDAKRAQEGDFVVKPQFLALGNQLVR